jgi:hypothetical protein
MYSAGYVICRGRENGEMNKGGMEDGEWRNNIRE